MPTLPGGPELIILILVIVIIFGWKKLPDAARSLGRSMRIFKAEVEEMKEKPSTSAASRDTVTGEARREAQYRDDDRAEGVRDGDRYVSGDSGARRDTPTTERSVPRDEDQYRPPTA